ncbi:MAG TPA: HNH endonuclease signature motif containing protein [Streptosporangiaceae bacterium]|nr:HNH endonuclease signature motif containing protein [Streptosporangiaceae bacterium]
MGTVTSAGSVPAGLVPVSEWAAWVREMAEPCPSVPDGGWLADFAPEELAQWYRLTEAEEAAGEPVATDDPAAAGDPAPAGGAVHAVVWPVGSRAACDGVGFGNAAADRITPGWGLAGLAERTWADGLEQLSDDELGGLILAWHRLGSWAAAGELAGLAELDRRRQAQAAAGADSRLVEHVGDEVAALLRMTSRGAGQQLDFAIGLAGLPKTAAALAAGEIDRVKALVIVGGVTGLIREHAHAVEDRVIGRAPGQTPSQLRASLLRAVLAVDAAAAGQRREKAGKDARVERWSEDAGTAALAGRDLPAAEVLQADARISAMAQDMKTRGWTGTLDQLRAVVFTALLLGHPIPTTPPVADTPTDTNPADRRQAGTDTAPGDRTHAAPASPAAKAGPTPNGAGLGGLRGSVNLTMPLATWLGASDQPGEAAGFGPLPAVDARALATLLEGQPGSRWCLTLTDRAGRAIAHGCATTSSGGGPVRARIPNGKHLTVTITPLAATTCDHSGESPHYRPPPSLAHRVQVRQRTCCFPGCRRPATRCDLDHTIPYDQGGRTCECSLAPLCRRHHRAKQAQGWHLDQPQPGVMVWRLPHGRTYTTEPDPYPDIPDPGTELPDPGP